MIFRMILSILCLICYTNIVHANDNKWVVYYGSAEPIESFLPYDLLVFEADAHPPLYPFIENQVVTLGYLNLGEVEENRDYFEELKRNGLLLEENKNWKGSYYIDIRNKYWSKFVVETLIPKILFQHFNGVFLDTIDNAEYLESLDPQKYKGMKQAAIDLIKAIRLNYPDMKIMLNRGYNLLPAIANLIDYELAESLYTHYNFEKKEYTLAPEKTYHEQVEFLLGIQKKFPSLLIFTLDYWNENDTKEIKNIYGAERANGFFPFVSTIDLNKVVPEPK